MKNVTFILILLLIAIGAFAGMLYAHVAPVTDLANRVPGAAPVLSTLGIYPSYQPNGAEISPTDQADVYSDNPATTQRSVHIPRRHARVRTAGVSRYDNPDLDTSRSPGITARLARIYDTMPASLVAKILTHQSDMEAARELSAMNDKRAGQVIAAIQPMRAAKIAAAMADQGAAAGSHAQGDHDSTGIAID